MSSVIVVGAGPVGQTAALLLARWGISVVVLDARPGRDVVGSRSIVQQRDVIDVWDTVGVGRRIAAEGVTWRTARTYHRSSELFAVEFVDSGRSPFPPFVNVSQARTEHLLDERLAGTPLAEVRWAHRVTGLADDADGVSVTCETPDGERVLRAPHVLVCAGAKADALRSALGLVFVASFGDKPAVSAGETFDDQFLICDLRVNLPGWEAERRFYFDPEWNPGRQVLVHPCPGGTFRVDWQVASDFDLAREEAGGGLDRRIRQIVGARPYEILWRSVYRFSSRIVPRMRVGRVLLAGDCAHLVSPFGARGLNSGVQDAENAAWKLAYVGNGWAPESLLETYHTERHAAASENLAVTAATMRFLVPRTEADRRYRADVLARAATDPAARALVDSGRLAEPFWYTDSALTTPNPRYPFTGRPPRGQVHPPAPGVLVPDIPARDGSRLRSLARRPVRGLTVVDHATVPEVPPGEAWVLRPDAHLAAIVDTDDTAAVQAAIHRATGH